MSLRHEARWLRVFAASATVLAAAVTPAWSQEHASTTSPTAPTKLPFTLAKETTVINSPVHADGTPDYVAALNEKYGAGATAQNNGFVIWVQDVGGSRVADDFLRDKARDGMLQILGASPTPEKQVVAQLYGRFLMDRGVASEVDRQVQQEAMAELRTKMWQPQDDPTAAEYLKSIETPLNRAVDAAERPRWFIPCVSEDERTVLNAQVPRLGQVREIALALCARATLRGKAGDFDGFVRDVTAAKRLSRNLSQGLTGMERAESVSIDLIAGQSLAAVAGSGNLSLAQCQALGRALAALPPRGSLTEPFGLTDRWQLLDCAIVLSMGQAKAAEAQAGGGDGDRNMALLKNIESSAVDWDLVLRRINTTVDKIAGDIAHAPTVADLAKVQDEFQQQVVQWKQVIETLRALRNQAVLGMGENDSLRKQAGESRDDYSQRVARLILGSWLDAEGNPAELEEERRKTLLQDDMLKVLLAAAEFKAKTGRWPNFLNELTPEYVKDIPKDIYSGDGTFDVRYDVSTNGVRISSIGPEETGELGVGPK